MAGWYARAVRGALAAVVAASTIVVTPAAAHAAPGEILVSGHVFEDRDRDGTRDPREPGVAGVVVSDGRTLVRSGRDGRYELTLEDARRRTDLVFVSQPSGYVVGVDADRQPRFHARVAADAEGRARADFALHRDRGSTDRDFRFVGLADVHVQAGTLNNRERFTDQLGQINALVANAARSAGRRHEVPRFAVVSGDLTNNATPQEFADYRAATATSTLPVWPAIGNHEYNFQLGNTYADIVENYRAAIGPEWYSFGYGGKHVVVLDDIRGFGQPEQLAWLTEDLRLAGPRQVVVITHIPLNTALSGDPAVSAQYVALFERYRAALLLAGHTHMNDVDDAVIDGALHAVTNSASYTIDGTPNGFRVVEFNRDRVTIPFREFDVRARTVTLVRPANGGTMPRERTTLQVNTFHTSSEVAGVAVRVDGERRWRPLDAAGDRTWVAAFDARRLAPGRHRIEAVVRQRDGRSRTTAGTFQVVSSTARPAQGAAWNQFHRDAAHSGATDETVEPPLGLAWSHQTGGNILTSSPAVVDGAVYVGVRDENGVARNGVVSLDLRSGGRRWWAPTDALVEGSVAVAGDTVLAGSVRGTLYGFDAGSGRERWTWRVNAPAAPDHPRRAWMYQAPAVDGDTVFQAYSASDGMHVAALDVHTGQQRWVSGSIGSTWLSKGTVVVGDGVVFAMAQGGQVSALDAATGAIRWQRNPGSGWTYASATVAGGLLLRPYSGDLLVAMDVATGVERWRYRSPGASFIFGSSTAASPAVRDGVAYMGFTDGAVTALDLATGRPRWTQPTGHAVLSSPAVGGDIVYAGSNDGRVRGFDRRTGQPLWSYDLGAWVASSPAVTGNALVVGAWDGGVYAFTPSGGPRVPRWSTVEGTVTSGGGPVTGARVLIRAATDRTVAGDTFTDANGHFRVAVPPGDYDVHTLVRAHPPGTRRVAVAGFGSTVDGSLGLTRTTGPIAGTTDLPSDTAAGSTRTDTLLGTTYGYVANDRVSAAIVPTVAANNAAGAAQPGWLADLTLADATGLEVLDWSEHVLTTRAPGAPDWNRGGEWLNLPDISADGDAVTARGTAQANPALRAALRYRALPDAPVIEMTLELTNTGDAPFAGYYQYVIDPDSPDDTAYVPGVAAANPGYLASGWTANYLYDGPRTATGTPAQGLAWPAGQPPVTLSAQGYVAGVWFDASVAAGAKRVITWYHITDYPAGAPDPTANIARWAATVR